MLGECAGRSTIACADRPGGQQEASGAPTPLSLGAAEAEGRFGWRSPASFRFEILSSLAARIEVPDGDIVAGRTDPTRAAPLGLIPTLAVRHQLLSPESTFAAVEYQGTWHWVDDADYASKRAFTGLMLILNVVEKIGQPQLPVITIPTG